MGKRVEIIRRHGINFVYKPWIFKNIAASECGKVLDLWNIGICNRPIKEIGGYKGAINLRDNFGKAQGMSEHRVVAFLFHRKKFEKTKLVVNHINGIPSDNRPDNLEWITNEENIHYHAFETKESKFFTLMDWCYKNEPLAYINTRMLQIYNEKGKDEYVITRGMRDTTDKFNISDFLPMFDWEDMDALHRAEKINELGYKY